jgi:hypothetical protein
MAKLDIQKYVGGFTLVWESKPARIPEKVADCNFCDHVILDNEEYKQVKEIVNKDMAQVFHFNTGTPLKACKSCASLAGLEW